MRVRREIILLIHVIRITLLIYKIVGDFILCLLNLSDDFARDNCSHLFLGNSTTVRLRLS